MHVDALWETLHMNAQSPKTSMNVRSVKVYDDVLSRSMTLTTNTKIMKKGFSSTLPAKLFFRLCILTLYFSDFQSRRQNSSLYKSPLHYRIEPLSPHSTLVHIESPMGSHAEPATRPAPAGVVQLEGLQPLLWLKLLRPPFLPHTSRRLELRVTPPSPG